jgi:D-proline reductase (dithiol) PrdB
MTVEYIRAIKERYERLGYQPYRWFFADTEPPWQPLEKPLSEIRLGMLSTSGAYALGQVAYHYKDDTSIREIPSDTDERDLRFSHITENYLVDPKRDPIGALRKLAAGGFIGQLADTLFSCMGGIYSQRRVREELAPTLLRTFKQQSVDAALLVPM